MFIERLSPRKLNQPNHLTSQTTELTQPSNQPANQSASHPTNHLTNHPDQSVSQPPKPLNQPNQPTI